VAAAVSELRVVEGALKPLSPFSPYRSHYYCAYCRRWIPRGEAQRDSMGRPVCPYCRRTLRVKPRRRVRRGGLRPFFTPKCPRCLGRLSQKLFSARLVCLSCGAEFELEEVVEG